MEIPGKIVTAESQNQISLDSRKEIMMRTDATTRVKMPAIVLLLLILPMTTMAGTITFLDLTDNVTFTDDTGRASGSCQGESCHVTLLSPTGTVDGRAGPGFLFRWVDPGTETISDTFAGSSIDDTTSPVSATILFASDTEGSSLGTCLIGDMSCGVEDGTVQTWTRITWTLATGGQLFDTIKFQSDVAEVPEPSEFSLVGIGVALVLQVGLRKRTA
jgi:hypothetical protein